MVVTKIEAGKYSIVTASGAKFEVAKQFSHCWNLKYTKTGEVKWTARTLKECVEVVRNYAGSGERVKAEKPVEPVKPEEVTKADESVKTEKADEPKSRVEKLMPDFLDGKVILNAPTHEARVLLMEEFVKNHLRWMASELVNYNDRFPNLCTCVRCEVGKIACESEAFYKNNYPLISIVTLTAADFDKPKKEFTKADLKTGMVVKCRNGVRCLVLRGEMETTYYGKQELVLINNESFLVGTNCNDKLEGIDSVYKPKITGLEWMLECDKEDLIWQCKPEYDWSKAEVDMPILGKHGGDAPWHKRYFAKYENGIVLAWNGGRTSWTTDKTCQWAYALPYKGNEHLIEGEDK